MSIFFFNFVFQKTSHEYTLTVCIILPYPQARCKQTASKKTAILTKTKEITFILLSVRQFTN